MAKNRHNRCEMNELLAMCSHRIPPLILRICALRIIHTTIIFYAYLQLLQPRILGFHYTRTTHVNEKHLESA